MTIYAYDVECFPNFFSVTFVDVKDEKNTYAFSIGLGVNEKEELKKFLNRRIGLVGYNNISYDDPMLRFLIESPKKENIEKSMYELSSMLVNDSYRSNNEIMNLRYPRKEYLWKTLDLMAMLGFNKLGISLKQTAINLRWHKIQDLPLEPEQEVKEEEFEKILKYNLNDVLITKRLYEEVKPLRELRRELNKIYSLDFSSASNSKIANLILQNIFTKELGKSSYELKALGTDRKKVYLKDCIAPFVKFRTSELQSLLERISSRYVYKDEKFRYKEELYFANCIFVLGIGGLHTKDAPGKFFTDENVLIQDADVSSYYPNLIINNNFYPKHLGPKFIEIFKRLTKERIEAKKSGDKIKADGLKITINSIFGKLGFEYFWLYDPKQFISTTVNGQLGLLMLIESLYLNGIKVISANTDGVVCEIPRELEDIYYEITKQWEKDTGLNLEYTSYKKYIRRDVNSYITEKMNGKTKEKGVFVQEINLMKSYHMPIVAKAIYKYFIKNIPIRETLENCEDIMMFCISQKAGKKFQVELHTNSGIKLQQKTNRFYITNNGGKLYKRDKTDPNKVIGLYVNYMINILNDYDKNIPFENYNINLSFYEQEAMKIIDEIEPPQMKFDF